MTKPEWIKVIRKPEWFVQIRKRIVRAAQRFPGLDDLPTIAETLPGFRIDGWFVVVAPAGTLGVRLRDWRGLQWVWADYSAPTAPDLTARFAV